MSAQPKNKVDVVTVLLVSVLLALLLWKTFQGIQGRPLLAPGVAAPDFALKGLGSTPLSLSKMKGQPLLLLFWATWCPSCREEMPFLLQWAKAHKAKGVRFVAINTDDVFRQRQAVETFLQTMPQLAPYTALGTPEVSNAYLIHTLPTLYLLDSAGKVSASHAGQVTATQLQRWLKQLR